MDTKSRELNHGGGRRDVGQDCSVFGAPRTFRRQLVAPSWVVAILALAAVASAQDAPVGSSFEVPSTPGSSQLEPSVAHDATGRFLVTWGDIDQLQQPSVFGRLYRANGTPEGNEFHLVSDNDVGRRSSRAAAMPDGGWYVVWRRSSFDPDGIGIEGQRLAADGSRLHQIPINQIAAFSMIDPDLTVVPKPTPGDPDGGEIVVVWMIQDLEGEASIRGRRIGGSGPAVGDEFVVSSGAGDHTNPRIASQDDGGYVVVWEHSTASAPASRVLARLFDANDTPLGPPFFVRDSVDGDELAPDVAMNASGEFVVVWRRILPGSSTAMVEAQRFDASGVAIGNRAVPGFSGQDQQRPAVAIDSAGRFLVTYDGPISNTRGLPAEDTAVHLARFLEQGESPTSVQLVALPKLNQHTSYVSLDPTDGDFVVVWQDHHDIQARRYRTNRVGDRVWHDVDGDGKQTSGEPGVPGISVHLFEDFGELLATATTDAQGEYFFDVIPPQDVYVDFELPASGWEFTIANVGVGVIDFVDSDADPNTGETITFPISAGVWSTKWDAGLRSVAFFADGFESGDTSAWTSFSP